MDQKKCLKKIINPFGTIISIHLYNIKSIAIQYQIYCMFTVFLYNLTQQVKVLSRGEKM